MSETGETNCDGTLTSLHLDESVCAGLALLERAYDYAKDADADLWDFALRIDKLYDVGVSISDLRWLIAKQFALHGQETSVYGDSHRSFQPIDGFNFERTSCLVLTPTGASLAEKIFRGSPRCNQPTQVNGTSSNKSAGPMASLNGSSKTIYRYGSRAKLKPNWDPNRRELRLADTVVKRFRRPAKNQETILCVFEEEGWPHHIDDPLPIQSHIDSQTRLHDAINRLNGHQANRLLRFNGNGRGTGVLWEFC